MAWRLMLAAVLVTLTLGCDRGNSVFIGPGPSVVAPVGLPLVVVTGTSTVTTTVFPTTPFTVPVGSTVACVGGGTTTPLQPLPVAGTVSPGAASAGIVTPGIVAVSGRPVPLSVVGTFTFGCAFIPGVVVTLIVV